MDQHYWEVAYYETRAALDRVTAERDLMQARWKLACAAVRKLKRELESAEAREIE